MENGKKSGVVTSQKYSITSKQYELVKIPKWLFFIGNLLNFMMVMLGFRNSNDFYTNLVKNVLTEPSSALITWKYVNQKVHWSLIFLLGGGFALAEAGKVSGMSALLGQSLSGLESLPPLALLFVVCLAAQVLTEFTSNVAICNILLPVLAEMAIAINTHPLYLMLPAAMSCSYAFHMPVGTPPNAIVAGVGRIAIKDMALAGIGPSIITLVVMWIGFPTWGAVVYPEIRNFQGMVMESAMNISVH